MSEPPDVYARHASDCDFLPLLVLFLLPLPLPFSLRPTLRRALKLLPGFFAICHAPYSASILDCNFVRMLCLHLVVIMFGVRLQAFC
jgi:hypothetical protein